TRVTVTGSTIGDNGSTGLVCSACASLDLDGSDVDGNANGGIRFSYDLDPVGPDRHIAITGSRITDNIADGPGGGISVTTLEPAPSDTSPIMTVTGSRIARNSTLGNGRPGGGIYSRVGELVVESSRIVRNRAGTAGVAGSAGGGIYHVPDTDGLTAARHDMTITASRVARNAAAGNGGGLYLDSDGAVAVHRTTLWKNTTAVRGRGGAVWAREAAPLLIEQSTLSANRATRGGGAYFDGRTGSSSVKVIGTTVSKNRATEYGGGVQVAESALVTLRNSTVSANRAGIAGGGIQAGTAVAPIVPVDGLALDFTTVRRNRAPQGGNLGARSGTVSIRTSVLVAAKGPGCTFGPAAVLASGGYTFTDDAACAGDPTDVVSGANPHLGPLKNNGGPTRTHLPAGNSPLVGLVPLGACTVTTDQRGEPRPRGTGCEPGSVEVKGKRRS
ncbi:MAG: right-handed parallel beta-helix repeat-containing protein, partial [Propionibacteriaceae bacterium]|nr:right-handed parallel beta-helix repeat-containing protein [Propionibacteriaceae bacterium]